MEGTKPTRFNEVKKTVQAYFKKYYSILIVSLIALIIVEILNHPNETPLQMFEWIFSHKRVMVLNYLIYVDICMLLYLIVNRLNRSNQLFVLLLTILGVSNHYKILMKGETVVFWDILNMQAAAGMMTELKTDITWQIVVSLTIAIITLVVLHKKPRVISSARSRLRTASISLVLLVTLTVGLFFNNEVLASLKVTNVTWSQSKNYRENGFALTFFMNLKEISIGEPDNYSEEAVNEAIDRIEATDINLPKINVAGDVNIIAIMVESMADISIANNGLVFNEELTPNINKINKNIIKGNLLVSIFGGYTANSEFEFLTGNSMATLPNGSVAYDRYVDEDTDSLVGVLKHLGYSAKAVHPYLSTFWNRDEVYPYFGFDEFLSIDDFSETAERKKGYVSDKAVGDKIIELYESKEEGKPLFLHSVTMENHTPYNDMEFGKVDVEMNTELFKESVLNEAGVHAKGVQDADALFGYLVEYFSNCDEPTMVVIFGDHQPFISSTIGISSDLQDDINKYKTPFAIWTNYDIEEQTDITLDSSAIGAYALAYAGIELPSYLKLNYYASSFMNGYNGFFVLGKNEEGNDVFYSYKDEMPEEISQYLADHELLQYDLFFGETYGKERLWSIGGN